MTSQLDVLRIGATQEAMATLRSLGFDYAPRTRYQPYARLLDDPTGEGKRVRRGLPRAWWTFEVLTGTELMHFTDLLDDEESAPVYVTTMTDRKPSSEYGAGQYADFLVLMRIAEKTEATHMRWENVVIEFTRLEEV